jgi:adhesin/invasin
MHKVFQLPGLFLFILTLCVCGCSGSSADPMGTGTVQFVSEYSAPITTGGAAGASVLTTAEVDPNSSLTLTAWVSNFTSDGKTVPVINERVTFTLDSPENGARLVALNDRTASNGQARVVYTAGNNLFPDVVRVTTEVGATASIRITKKGAPRGSVVALAASPVSTAPLGISTITATVTDNGLAVQGERVTFKLLTNNEASLSVSSVLTNASGQAITTYQAGNNMNQDMVQASLANGAIASVIITKSGAAPGRVVTLVANPASVAPVGFSVLTAKVTDSGVPMQGELVNFVIRTSNGATLSDSSGYSDAAGNVVTVYRAGNNTAPDTIVAWLHSGSTSEVIITKSGVPSTISITLKADPATIDLNAVGAKGSSAITATVKDSSGAVIKGATVTFTASPGGTFDVNPVVTGVDGNAVTLFTTDGTSAGSFIVKAATQDASSAVSILVTFP